MHKSRSEIKHLSRPFAIEFGGILEFRTCFILGLRENRDYGIPLILRIMFFPPQFFQALNGWPSLFSVMLTIRRASKYADRQSVSLSLCQ